MFSLLRRHQLKVLDAIAALALMALSQSVWAMSASPSPSTNGSYTVSWSTPLGCTTWGGYPYYETDCYSLLENGVEVATSGTSLGRSGVAAGSYNYQVYYTLWVAGSPWDGWVVESVTEQVVPPPPSFSVSDAGTVTEGSAMVFTVTRSGTTAGSYSMNYLGTAGTANSWDYTPVSGTLTFASGETSKNISVPTTADSTYESSKTILMYLSSPTGGATLADDFAFGMLASDDAAPSFSVSDVTVAEGNTLNFTVTKTGATEFDHSVTFATAADSAGSGDFTARWETLTFTTSETSKTVGVATTQDAIYEGTERLYVNLSSATNGATIGDSQGYGDITNDDSPPSFTISDTSVSEGGTLYFTVTKNGASDLTHGVSYATATGSAGSGDFTAASGTLSFASGDTAKTVNVSTTQDAVYESTERLYVNLSGATNAATIADSQGYGDITNDDAGPSFSINDVSIGEGGTLSFTVTKSGSTELAHDVSYATATGTAGSGDFTAASGTLSFASGDATKTVNVSTTQDSTYEGTERLYVNLSGATNGASISDSQGYGDITNDDSLSVPGTPSGPTGNEYTGAYTISWSSVADADNYRLEEQLNGGGWSEIHNAAGTSKGLSGKGVGSWGYRARACNNAIGGCSGYSSTKTVTVATPAASGAPSGPSGNEYTGAYTISWSSVTGADSYRLEEQLGGGAWSEIHNAAGTSKAVSGKTPGTWGYRARACSAVGCGDYSSTANVTVAAPAAPGTPAASSYNYGGSYTVTWSGTTGAATYTLQERIDGGSWTTIQDTSGTSKSVTAAAEGTRQYQVRACSGAGCSGYSSSATVAVVMPPATTGAKPGAIPGAFSVGTQGEASYSIPIAVPAGTGGLKPSVALSYNHLAGNGLAGMRWTLSGISAITLCSATFAQDGEVAPDAVLCLNGQRLVNFEGDYYAADTEYRTEIESFQRIVQQGTGSSASFYVDHGNGLRSYFGESSDSRITASGIVRTWYISRTVDQFGNTIAYGYDHTTADGTLPGTITWTGNSTVSPALSPHYAITITYESRPADDQRSGYYRTGGTWSRTQRIDQIAVTYNDGTSHEIATYALTYASAAPPNGTGRSRLTGVSVCRGTECLPETVFTVQEGASGWDYAQSTDRPVGTNPLVGDWNGDGRMDLLAWVSSEYFVYPGNADGLFDAYVDTNFAPSGIDPSKSRIVDLDGDGRADLLYQDGSSNWKVALSNGSSGFGSGIDIGLSTSYTNPVLQDHDGDGLADLIYVTISGIDWRRNTGGSFGSASTLYSTPATVQTFGVGTVDSAVRSFDADGDGRADLLVEVQDCTYNPNDPNAPPVCVNNYDVLLANGAGYAPVSLATNVPPNEHFTNFRAGDFNGDGLGDLLFLNEEGTLWVLKLSKGDGTFVSGTVGSIPVTNASKVLVADYDGDGRDDLLRPDGSYWRIHRSTGAALEASYSDSVSSITGTTAFTADIAGSGYPEIVFSSTYWSVHPRHSTLTDVVTDFTDGLGRTVSVEYASLAQTDAYTRNPAHVPDEDYVRAYGGPRYVVTTETHDDGIGGTRNFEHTYDTAAVNTAGRGWLAFYQHTVKDVVQDTYARTTYSQTFPTAGIPVSIEQHTITGDKLIRSVTSTLPALEDMELAGSSPPRQFPRVAETTTVEKEVGGANDGDTLRTVIDTPEYDTAYGFVTDTVRTVKVLSSDTDAFETTIHFDRQVIDDAGQWCLGLPGTVETIKSTPDDGPVSRTVDTQYNGDCTVDTVTDLSDASHTAKQLRRKLGYDDFGNVTSVKEYSVADEGTPSAARETTFAFDDDGQFPESVTVEGVDLTTTFAFDPLSGLKTSVTGPDQLTTSYQYDAFGRLTQETRPAASADAVGHVDVSYHVCASGGCFTPNAAFYVKALDTTGAASYTFFDAFERPVGSDAPLAGGYRSRTKTQYQASGRVDQRSLPYVAGEEAAPGIHWVTMDYDALGRPVSETDESTAATTYSYLGHELAVEDGNSHTTHYLHNALGQIEEVDDAKGGSTTYTYYPFGELHTVTDNDSNTTTVSYDPRGFKLAMDDPDLGHWSYVHNAFGELVSQTDAKSQTVTLAYDDAGRLEHRYEAEGTTTFTFYSSTADDGNVGRLHEVTSPGSLSEAFEYDTTHGAVTKITRTIGAKGYVFDYAYDGQARLSHLTYPTNVHSDRLEVEYLYDTWSVLSQVKKVGSPATVYYALNAQEASGAVRKATLGNGIVEQYGYEPETGQLASIKAGLNGSAALQNLRLEWDLAGNLDTRRVLDATNTLVDTDVFAYDELDRLLSQTRDSTQIFGVTYDTHHLGNIATKTDAMGTKSYGYGGSAPHAVTAYGSMTFGYDANGNMEDRNGDTITWTSYNLPSRIDGAGGTYSEFLYGGDRSRYVQVEDDGTSTHTRHYAAPGLFEAVYAGTSTTSHLIDYQYVHANGQAVAQITTTSSGDDPPQYLHRDQQGSVVATTDDDGDLVDRFEYDPFGQRTATVGSEDGNARGYTGHEHLAALGLVHMNGRVQDPLLGRFLSADPTVQAPYYSQSLNRYSYAWNNPLTLVDPSGFQTCNGAIAAINNPDLEEYGRRLGGPNSDEILRACGIEPYPEPDDGFTFANELPQSSDRCDDGCHHPPQTIEAPDVGGFLRGVAVGFIDNMLEDAWYSSAKPEYASYPGEFSAADVFGQDYVSPFDPPTSAAEATGRRWSPIVVLAGAVLLRNPSGAARGTATVIEHAGSHASVLVRSGNTVLHTEQIVGAGGQTTIAIVENAAPAVRSLTVSLPDAAAAMRYQQSVLGQATGTYNAATNSCVTHCGDVLRAGGLEAPSTTRRIVTWLRGLGGD